MIKKRVLWNIVSILVPVIFLIPRILNADTVILNNGTLLVGKVKSEFKASLVFKNSYGAFAIQRDEISALYVTKSYKEDIAVRKKLGMDFDEKEIRNNYEAGQKELTEKEKTLVKTEEVKSGGPGISGKIFLEGTGMASYGELKDAIPYGYGGFTGLETGETYIDNTGRNSLIPWFRIEAGYLDFSKDDMSLSGFTGGAGPLWFFPLSGNGRSNMRLSLEPGVSSIRIKNGNVSASTVTFTFHSIIGYEYSFDSVSLFINFRYMYLYDKDVFYNSAGVSAGVSGRLW
ncbi:MAG TPA: hypothetical protein PKG60_15365 [Spirochaetota bacterium]|nr:hypothetical protein [Spirochaetota bacterium]